MAFNDDEKPPASNVGSTKGLVTISTPTYSKDAAALTADAVTAVVELNATSSTAVREGLDLVAVLDVSGSMQGDKLQSMKRAMQFVIMKLTPVDRLSVISFASSANRHCPLRSVTQQAQTDLKSIVDGLVANGGTNIKAGLDTALAVIAGRATTKARTPNIFLMSDGQQSDGDARQVDPGNVAVYTFGFGKDADHALLSDVAKKSPGGTFNSVPDGGNVSAPFSQLLGGLLTIVAQDVQLTLTPKAEDPSAPDLDTMTVAPGTDYTQTTDGNTGVITIKFGTLFSGETRKVAINLKLLESTLTTAYDGLVAEAQHSYTVQGSPQGQTPQDIAKKFEEDPTAPLPSADDDAKEEMAANPLAAISAPIAFYIKDKKNNDDKSNRLRASFYRWHKEYGCVVLVAAGLFADGAATSLDGGGYEYLNVGSQTRNTFIHSCSHHFFADILPPEAKLSFYMPFNITGWKNG
ncbi:unnamed protein product [Triticum turgidum subsp. durum]|uniref:VWFA domain-containing protein n=1 Tax=Triticum turgidum subsp. durum TaxID=4567 RepID=A0A9R0YYQ9_TRITD|nr:unnamed protein product [Triticum turgidum subsp. durum]